MDEYKIVHGCEPNNSEYNRYKGLVEKEFEQDKSSNDTKATNFHDYLYERQKNMEDKIFSPENVDASGEVSLTKDREGLLSERSANMENADIVKEKGVRLNAINNTRNTILQGHKNLDAVKDKPIKNLTLKDFMKVMPNVFKKNNQGNSNTIDPSKAPIRSKRER